MRKARRQAGHSHRAWIVDYEASAAPCRRSVVGVHLVVVGVATHLVVAARQHRVEGVFGSGVQLAALGQVGVALEVHDRLDGAVVHVAGDRAVVVVELAQLLLKELDRRGGAYWRSRRIRPEGAVVAASRGIAGLPGVGLLACAGAPKANRSAATMPARAALNMRSTDWRTP